VPAELDSWSSEDKDVVRERMKEERDVPRKEKMVWGRMIDGMMDRRGGGI
jgi:hypothetical protein